MTVECTAPRCTMVTAFLGDANADAISTFGVRICDRTSIGSVLVNDDDGDGDDDGDTETEFWPPSRFGNEFMSNDRGAIACA